MAGEDDRSSPMNGGFSSSSSKEPDDVRRRRSFVWPFVAVFMTAVAFGHMFSFKKRLSNFEQVSQGNRSTRQSNGGRRKSSFSDFKNTGSGWVNESEDFSSKVHARDGNPWVRMQQVFGEEHMDMFKRMERIRRLQDEFHRERSRRSADHDKWQDRRNRQHEQGFNVEYWFWNGESWVKWGSESSGNQSSREKTFNEGYSFTKRGGSNLKHYFEVLGLDWEKADSYTDAEIKAAYRVKAMEFHPDRSQHHKDYSESKFREVVAAYEAINSIRKS